MAAEELHGSGRPQNAIPESEQPDAGQVRRITVLASPASRPGGAIADDGLLAARGRAVTHALRGHGRRLLEGPGVVDDAHLSRDIESAARRLAEAAQVLFWSQASGHPTPLEALTRLLAHGWTSRFAGADLTREVLDDLGDDEVRIAFWLVFPDERPGGGFRKAVGFLYEELLGASDDESTSTRPAWAAVLGIAAPFHSRQVPLGRSCPVQGGPPRCRRRPRGVPPLAIGVRAGPGVLRRSVRESE